MNTGRPITEADLHAYVDGVLDPARRAEVEVYLGSHPDIAQRIYGYEEQQRMLRQTLAPIAEESIPPELNLARLIEARRRSSRLAPWRAAAAAVLLFGVGSTGGWVLHGVAETPAAGTAALAQEAAYNYMVFSPDRVRPVELKDADITELVQWIAQRLGSPVAVPDLTTAGYRFMGGRLVATAHGPAGLFMYDNDHGTRLAMLVRPMETQKAMKMSRYTEEKVNGFAWADNGLGYSLVSAAPPEILHPLADEVRRQVSAYI
jgi:anti-sigma factor RsiW